ncbi:HD-GYP domain-containing protein [Candidatus Bipolaricaulota bacterium]|nr:HD-GYP domain-containing protein [Candidatus Bipolaricaulota bacterium]TFH09047.1 MAG: HD-GYP domain-containing protein [Candidatus Atribacteria bacterium]
MSDRVDKRTTSLELLAMSGSLEITRQRIEAGKHFNLYAADDWAGFEFMYLLSGVLALEDGQGGEVSIQVGDYIYHNGLPEEVYFRVETDVELLLVCTPPSFHLIRDDMQEIMALARSVEEKDQQTEGHCSRLERLATLTGERLGLPGKQLIALSYGAYLHDIGKVMVADEILGKTSALSDTEWEEMQRHPDHGAEMLSKKQFLSGAAEVVRAHHERFDGDGYPRGLSGDEIPIGARVVAVVDTYDAIVSARPYKKALAKEEAIQELEKNAGTQFDPRVVKAFLDVVKASSQEDAEGMPHAE